MASSGEGKVVIVTGANTGIGFETCRLLAKDNYEIILACRTESKALEAIKKLCTEFPSAKFTFMQLDLSQLSSVREFVRKFKETGKPLHILINNAGMSFDFKHTDRQTSPEGFELTMASNHLGHFLLTTLLQDDLVKTGTECGVARIVVLASSVHDIEQTKKMPGVKKLEHVDPNDLQMEKPGAYNGLQAYRNSKAANIMFTYELARRLEGTNVTVNCLCPGFIPSSDFLRNAGAGARFFTRYVLDGFMKYFKKVTRSLAEGAGDVFWLATSPDLKGINGKYYCKGLHEPCPSKDETNNEELQHQLWKLSEDLVSDKRSNVAGT